MTEVKVGRVTPWAACHNHVLEILCSSADLAEIYDVRLISLPNQSAQNKNLRTASKLFSAQGGWLW